MNRPLKFRAWDKTYDRWIELSNYALDPENGEILIAHDPGEFVIFDGCDYELMQFTGLKDKNGKEIFEGDLVKRTGEIVWTKDKKENAPREVYYIDDDACWWVRGKDGYNDERLGAFLNWGEGTLVEVIGNIYENPDLLPSSDNQ